MPAKGPYDNPPERNRRYPDTLRAICDEHGLIERVNIGGPEPLSEGEVEYVRADLHRGAVS